MVHVALVMRRDKLSRGNQAPIYIRLTQNRRVTYLATGVLVAPHNWDKANKVIRKSVPNAGRLNALLTQRYAEVQALALNQEIAQPGKASSKKIKQQLAGESEADFFEFANRFLEGFRIAGKAGTYDKCKGIISKLKSYMQDRPLRFSDITVDFLIAYERYLRQVRKNHQNTVFTNMKLIKRVFTAAQAQDTIDYNLNPFRKYRVKPERTSRPYLTEEEIARIERLDLKEGDSLAKARAMFVFTVYGGGLRVSDLVLLKWENFTGSHICFSVRKTRQQHSIKLPPKALTIVEEFKRAGCNPRYVFDYLPENFQEKDPFVVDKATTGATIAYNQALKLIGKQARISKTLTSHVARHSFACLALKRGMPLDRLQRILTHASPVTTMVYAQLVSEQLDQAMDLMA